MLCVIGKTIRMVMIELRMFSYNFAHTIMSNILYQKNQNKASVQRKIC